MSRSSFFVRTATALVALPVFYILIFVLKHHNHLALSILAVPAAVLGAREMQVLLRNRGMQAFGFAVPLAAVFPAAAYLQVSGWVSGPWASALPAAALLLVLLRTFWIAHAKELEPLLQRVAASLLVLVYPALLLSFIVRLTGFPRAEWILLFFFCINIANDILAYLAGVFLGRSTRLGLAVSPNKSAIGFIAGAAAAVTVAFLFRTLLPRLLPIGYLATALFGLAAGFLTIAGDLVESALKRSAQVKDSGRLIPGRGGILDSIDSWLLTAPLFYFVFLRVSL